MYFKQEKIFSIPQNKLINSQILKVIWESLFFCYKGVFLCERVIYVNDDSKFEQLCEKLKTLAYIFLENYYYTLKWSENECFFSQNCLEKYFIISYIIMSHSTEQKFINSTHYHDFHSRFMEYYDITEKFYNLISLNLKWYLKCLSSHINLILKKDSLSKSSINHIK